MTVAAPHVEVTEGLGSKEARVAPCEGEDLAGEASSRARGGATICVITTSYPAFVGDPSGHFIEAEVRELTEQGRTVHVIKPEAGAAFGWPGAAARLRENPLRVVDAMRFVARATLDVRRLRPERIIAHWAVPCAVPIAASRPLDGVDLEIVSHGADVRLLLAMPTAARRHLVRSLTRRAARWRFVSEDLFVDLARGLPAELTGDVARIKVVRPSPLHMPDVTRSVHAHRRTLHDRKLYVVAARLVEDKRVDLAIDYVATRPRDEAPVLVVLGDGPERARLEEIAHRWALDARFLGKTPRHEALAWIGAADELVHASAAEGCSTVLREAEHLGVRVTRL